MSQVLGRPEVYPTKVLTVMPMKNTSTISLMIQEFVFIQSRALGRNTLARLPRMSTRRAGSASKSN